MSHGGENCFFSGWPVMMPSLPATSGGELSTLSKMMQACKHNIGDFSLFHVPTPMLLWTLALILQNIFDPGVAYVTCYGNEVETTKVP